MSRRWFSRKERQFWDGCLGRGGRYRRTVESLTSIPSLWSSAWMRGAPHVGFKLHMWRIDVSPTDQSAAVPPWACSSSASRRGSLGGASRPRWPVGPEPRPGANPARHAGAISRRGGRGPSGAPSPSVAEGPSPAVGGPRSRAPDFRRLLSPDTRAHTAILIQSPIAARFHRVVKNPVISGLTRFSLPTGMDLSPPTGLLSRLF
jgi:hypothetical protein